MKFERIFLLILFSILVGNLNAQVVSIPLKFSENHIFLRMKLNANDSLNVLFDTGCIGTTIDSATAENAGIKSGDRRTVEVSGLGGSQNYQVADHETLGLSTLQLTDVSIVLANMKALSSSFGFKVDGIIGYDVLKKYITKVDFTKKQFVLYSGLQSSDTIGYNSIPIELHPDILIPQFPVSITLANKEVITDKIMFDSGNESALIIRSGINQVYDIEHKLGRTKISKGLGANAITTDLIGNIESMAFSKFAFGKMGVRVRINSKATPARGNLGLLGMPIIKRFDFILDYGNHKLYLKKNKYYNNVFKLDVDKEM